MMMIEREEESAIAGVCAMIVMINLAHFSVELCLNTSTEED